MRLLVVGAIGKAHGLAGGCYVKQFNPDSPLWSPGRSFQLLDAATIREDRPDVVDASPCGSATLEEAFVGAHGRTVCRFAGVRHRDQAEALRGRLLAVPVDEIAPCEDDEFFYYEIKGWPVVDVAGQVLGHVTEVLESYVELLEVRPVGGGPTFIIPVVTELVAAIDRAQRRVVITPPEGLIP